MNRPPADARDVDRRFIHEELHRDLSAVRDQPIVVAGCGALGGWAAQYLARMGMRRLTLIDDDRVQEHNLGTQPYRRQDVGGQKAAILANDLYRLAGTCEASPLTERFAAANAAKLLDGAAVVLDAFDNHAGRQAIQTASGALKLPCLHAGMSGEGTGDLHWEPGYTVPPDVELADPCAYPLGLALVQLTATTAAELVVRYLLEGDRTNLIILRDQLRIVAK